ncbi:Tripartite DNA replication factor [Homalodisca vitripennis]|nr:Tripartite DNA replication factor [Homalodisca vitripennis]KAG8265264.1 Tripartite DNA replication factor [Homalodisca vitripennis]
MSGGVAGERVGVIAPYRAQVELLRKRTACLTGSSRIEVNTVDQYQGRDKDIILYSCTRSRKPTESDILGDKNRLTVAITRARHKLIIIGNLSLLRDYKLFSSLFRSVSDDCIIPVS